MAMVIDNSIEKLRKKSRILLARVDEDSKRVNTELKKLHLQTVSLINYHNRRNQNDYVGISTDLWKLRNDSSGVSAVLCPDYFHDSPKRATASVPDMMSSKKLTLISKKHREQYSKIAPRKPVKGCYCCSEVNKAHLKSSSTQHKQVPCRQCKSQFEFRHIREADDKAILTETLTSPISCETFRRIRKIDYMPKSQFLRNVQNKICELQSGGQGDCLRTCPRSSSYHRFMSSTKMQDVIPDEEVMLSSECKCNDERQETPATPKAPANSIASKRSESDRNNVAYTSSKETETSSRNKSKLRKTISSRRQVLESGKEPTTKSPIRNKRMTQLRKQDCQCCRKTELESTTKSSDRYEERHYGEPIVDYSVDQEMDELRKFREQNYFETHGSSHTLTSSRSSGSLQQYMLNERLFAEPVRRIHKHDLVVTMPSCATIQKKRIHYFPRHVVRQEKNICNTNYKRKQCQSCPLTGHAIDLGILKARPPLNSLALKYQKKIP